MHIELLLLSDGTTKCCKFLDIKSSITFTDKPTSLMLSTIELLFIIVERERVRNGQGFSEHPITSNYLVADSKILI
jgi:hypothetical protein